MGLVKRMMEEYESRGYGEVPDKFVCANCVNDRVLKNYITTNASGTTCSYCGKRTRKPRSIDMDAFMEFFMEGLRYKWTELDYNNFPYDDEEHKYLGIPSVYSVYEILCAEEWLLNSDLIDDISNIISADEWCKHCEAHISDSGRSLLDYWHYFCYYVKHNTRYYFHSDTVMDEAYSWDERDFLTVLDDITNQIKYVDGIERVLPSGTTFFRGRKNNNRDGYEEKDLCTPNIEHSKYPNRMSPAGIPMFYGALDKNTMQSEITDTNTKYITYGCFVSNTPLIILDFTDIPPAPSYFDDKNRNKIEPIEFLKQYSHTISSPVPSNKIDNIEYVPTQVMCEYFRHRYKSKNNDKIDGIIYPSAKSTGKNIVLFQRYEDFIPSFGSRTSKIKLEPMSIETIEITK
ncbi:MAG: HEPN-associated N-terminal domain-containing protein [Negativicutes bacterium]|jgi:hypothetical protein